LSRELIDADWWLATGDVGVLNEDGCLRVVDRKKDLIIRGATNISRAEVEQLLAGLPGVAEAPSWPSLTSGSVSGPVRSCASDRASRPPAWTSYAGTSTSPDWASRKWSEELVVVDDFSRTPSGKIKKFVLRAQVSERPA
jgi:acyl-CoA synthetase (AMP-forming)/AMP-acid ligase II